jgi:hypothetical protein
MALTQISTQGIKDGTITGTDLATNVDLVDNQKLRLGTGNDLQIYHNGSNSYIDDTGTGKLFIRSNEVRINKYTNEFMIRAIADGAVELYYDHSKKFETTSGGVQVTDNLNMSGGHIFLADNYKLNVGTGDDLQIYHDGTNDRIDSSGTFLILEANNHIFRNPAGNEDYAKFLGNGAVELYYDNVKKFQTTNGGINITGSVACSGGASNNLSLPDNGKAKFGDGDDLQIYHLSSGGGDSYITNSNGNLNIVNSTDGWIRLQPKSGEEGVIVKYDGAVELYHDNSKKFETTSDGVSIPTDSTFLRIGAGQDLDLHHNGTNSYIRNKTGDLHIRPLVAEEGIILKPNGAVELYHDNSKKLHTHSGGITISGSIHMDDNNKYIAGTSDDLKIYHDGSNSFIDDSGTGNLVIRSSTIAFENAPGGGENLAKFIANGAVKFYHDNTQRFETVSNGFRLVHSTGNVDFHFNRFIVNAGQTFFIDHTATGADFQIRTSDSSGLDTTALQILGSGCLYNRCRSGSQANLTLRKQITGADGIDYLQTRNQNNNLRTAIKGNGGISNYQSNDTNLSDETMKKNIVDCESIIEKFKQWKLRKFNYNSDVDGTPLTYGLIAQEIETLHSDLVSADFPVYESGEEVMKKTVKDHQLMMLSFKALQEAIAKIEVLETEVAALKAA